VIRVGLTGTVGAGKSTVGRMFERWGAWRVDADDLARRAVEPGSPALEAIREALERIVHPAIQALRAEALAAARGAGVRVLVAEIPLLLEKELEDDFDVVVVVDAPQPVRRGRIQSERGLEPGTFEAIESAQWPAGRKRAAADLVIVNDGDLGRLERRARSVWDVILERHGGAT
jgi:dephospho-CoA kinase